MRKKYGANVSPCSIPDTMSKQSVSPSGEQTFTFVFLYIIIMAATVSLGRPQAGSICSIFPLCMESKGLAKSINNRFFVHTPSRIRQIVKICDAVDLFFQKRYKNTYIYIYNIYILYIYMYIWGSHGLIVIIVGNGYSDLSSNSDQSILDFHIALILFGKV